MNRNDHDDDETVLLQRMGALPRDIQPDRDLWPAVSARIAPPAANNADMARQRFARAAAVLVTVCAATVAGAWLGYGFGSRQGAAVPADRPAGAEVQSLELAFATARENYLRQLAVDGQSLDAPGREALRSQLAVIDRAVHQLHAAMASDPDNPLYLESLLMTREREMDMLAEFSTTRYTRL